jgi:hypothetical protein
VQDGRCPSAAVRRPAVAAGLLHPIAEALAAAK